MKKVIISSHQRICACNVLGIDEVSYKMIQYENEEKEIIESNLRQRVFGNTNPVKLGRCFSFLNNWYGFEHGGDRKSSEKVFNLISSDEPKTQKEFAESYGITQKTINNYMRMASMISVLDDLDSGQTW